jgi:hypothetical protein
LDAGVASGEGHQAKGRVDLAPELQAATVVQPGIHFLRIHAKGHGGKKLGGFGLTFPVVRRAVAHLRGALGNRVEHFQRRHQFTATVDFDRQPAAAHARDQFRQPQRTGAHSGKIGWPGGHHFPVQRRCG